MVSYSYGHYPLKNVADFINKHNSEVYKLRSCACIKLENYFLGVNDFIRHIYEHPTDINTCMQAIKVLDINVQTMKIFGAQSKECRPISIVSSVTRSRFAFKMNWPRFGTEIWNGRDGIAVSRPRIPFEMVVSAADNIMYDNKAQYCRCRQNDR